MAFSSDYTNILRLHQCPRQTSESVSGKDGIHNKMPPAIKAGAVKMSKNRRPVNRIADSAAAHIHNV